ncbi:MAG: serine/threonine protein kinase [Armatimonadetes bacterium]|nr:serine/threonine protein kinase [Armatimonadota bacterium]
MSEQASPDAVSDPAFWDKVKAAFQEVADRPKADRPAALDRLNLDTHILAEVAMLLESHEASGDFLEAPILTAPSAPDDVIGTRVGPYEVKSVIGSGGMGVVYLAGRADREFEMQAAIKIVKRGMDSDEILRRFRDERQTLARLEHPNIAKLLDGGSTESGQPYLVMEYVRGTRVDRFCDEAKWTIAERLRLFRVICEAVQHAHQQLVIHRDLKPDNILVTEEGMPKLIDFGIARVLAIDSTAAPEVTRLVDRRMTLAYASPEQVRGEPMSTSSDIYSLGVILYELLTGQKPYRQPLLTVFAYEKAIGEGPVRPRDAVVDRTLRRQLQGDLDTILLKAIDPDPARRYASAQQLADDIDRHLQGLPVIAQSPTFRYRAAKFVRRHRAGVSAAAIVLLALAGGVAGILWQARVARAERDRAQAQARRAQQISDFMVGVFRSADPEEQGRNVTVAAALDSAVERAESTLANQPDELATIRATIGSVYLQLGQIEKSVALLERAIALRRERSPNSDELFATMTQLGGAYQNRGDLPRAEALYREAVGLARGLHGPEHLAVAQSTRSLGSVLYERGQLKEAEAVDRDTLALLRRLPNVDQGELAQSLNNLAVVLGTSGKWSEAVPLQREALEIITKQRSPKHPEVASAMSSLASALSASGQSAEAEAMFQKTIALREEALGPDHPSTAFSRYNYASMLVEEQRWAPAIPQIKTVLALRGRVLPDGHPIVAAVLVLKGRAEMAAGDLAAAENDFRESVKLRASALPQGHWLRASAEGYLGECLTRARRFTEAQPLLIESHRVMQKAVGDSDERTRAARERLATLYDSWGRPEEAAKFRQFRPQ